MLQRMSFEAESLTLWVTRAWKSTRRPDIGISRNEKSNTPDVIPDRFSVDVSASRLRGADGEWRNVVSSCRLFCYFFSCFWIGVLAMLS